MKKIMSFLLLWMFVCGVIYANTVKDISVDELTEELKAYSGKILLLTLIHTRYPSSEGQLNWFKEVSIMNTEIKVVAVAFHSSSETRESVQKIVDKFSLKYPVYITDDVYRKEYGVSFFPTTFIVGEEGDILEEVKGAEMNVYFKEKVEALTNKKMILRDNKLPSLDKMREQHKERLRQWREKNK